MLQTTLVYATPDKSNQHQDNHFSHTIDGVSIVLTTIGLYALLMMRYPIIYGGDTIARLVDSSRIINGHQLPLLQAFIYLGLRLHYGPESIFLLMALISAAACAGIYALTRALTQDRRAALLAAVFYGTHPFILYYSRVPYQEPLLLAGVTWGFYYLFRPATLRDRLLASLFFGVACLSRYEGWIAVLMAAAFDIWRNRDRKGKTGFLSVCRSAFLFGWVPAAWVAWNGDLSPKGTYVLDLALRWGRLYRPYFIAKSALWWTESAVVLFALIGFAYFALEPRMRRDARFHTLLGLVALFMFLLVFSGHGIEPDPMRIVTEREAFIPISVLVLYAGIGAGRLLTEIEKSRPSNKFLRYGISLLVVATVTGYSLNQGFHRVAAANADPELKTDYEVAQFLAVRHARGLVFAKPLPLEPMKSYLNSVEKWSGPKGREKAVQLLNAAETTPLDYQRVLTYSWLGKSRIFSADLLKGLDRRGVEAFLREKAVDYIVVFSDFVPLAEHESILSVFRTAEHSAEVEIRNGSKAAQIFPVRFPAD